MERDCCAFANWSVHRQGDQLVLEKSAESAEGIGPYGAMLTALRCVEASALT